MAWRACLSRSSIWSLLCDAVYLRCVASIFCSTSVVLGLRAAASRSRLVSYSHHHMHARSNWPVQHPAAGRSPAHLRSTRLPAAHTRQSIAAATPQVRRKDVLSVWSGIRPLAKDPSATSTADAVRDHLVIADPSGLITVTGGKWTTYRLMAEDGVDAAIEAAGLKPARPCSTERLKLLGAERYSPSFFAHLAQVRTAQHSTVRHIRIETGLVQHPNAAVLWALCY